ncbi:MAG: DUF4340 domain-containing protein [Anaerolineae bacterium]|jgi:hypothetical protein
MKRQHQILAAVLVVQIALSAFVFWPRSAATGGEPLFPELESGDVVVLTVTDDQGESTALRKVEGEWVVPDADDYPADGSKIAPVLENIAALSTGRLVTRTDASHERLQVAGDGFARRLDFETADGAAYTVYLGSSPSYGTSHFRLEGQDEVYLTGELSTFDVSGAVASWVDAAYFTLDQNELKQVTLENGSGAFTFVKDDEGNWTWTELEADEELATENVRTVVSRATSVTLLRPLGTGEDAAYGLDDPLATVTLETEDRTITLRVGAQDPDDSSYVVKVSESSYYVRVNEYSVQPLVENTRDDFVQQPTPTPEVAPTPEG